jgi:hypothetical protein
MFLFLSSKTNRIKIIKIIAVSYVNKKNDCMHGRRQTGWSLFLGRSM